MFVINDGKPVEIGTKMESENFEIILEEGTVSFDDNQGNMCLIYTENID